MPWCEECAKYYTPNSVNTDGSCPTCGARIQRAEDRSGDAAAADTEVDESTPWHFKLLVVAVVVYLVWRFADLFT